MDSWDVQAFAQSWLSAWNAHDLDAVLSHFAENAVFTSPVAGQLIPETKGRLVGKDAIRTYWRIGLAKIPDLHFDIVNVYTGVDVLVINYRNHIGGLVNEVLHLNDDGLVVYGSGTYLTADAAGASGA